jgi:uncharacterized protein YfaS (alpha-2-macroglobulin family)
MRRVTNLPSLCLLLALAACGADAPGSPAGEDGGDRSTPVAGLSLRAARPFLAGEEPTLGVHVAGEGHVDLNLYRASDPVALVAAFDDLRHPTVEKTSLRAELNRALRDAGVPADRVKGDVAETSRLEHVRSERRKLESGDGTLALGVLDKGLYLLEAQAGRRVAYVPVVVGDLALVVKRSGDETLVWTVNGRTGAPVPGAKVTLLAADLRPRDMTADADGVARTKLGDVDDPRVVALAGDEVAVVDPAWLPPARLDRMVYLTTDRPLYRPGETVRVKGVARRVDGGDLVPLRAATTFEALVPPRGDPVPWTGPTPELTDLGTFSGSADLPEKAPHGDWRVVVRVDGRRYAAEFRVESFRRPESEVLVAAEEPVLLQGEKAAFDVRARTFTGDSLGGAKLSWTLKRVPRMRPAWRSPEAEMFLGATERSAAKPVQIAKGDGKLDADGGFRVEVPTEERDDDVALLLTASVRDESGRTVTGRGSLLSVRSLVTLDLRTDREAYEIGDTIAVTVRVRDHGGRPVDTDLILETRIGDGEPTRSSLRTDANGLVRGEVRAERAGAVAIRATALDRRERPRVAEKRVWAMESGLAPGYGGEGITIVPDREFYAPGDEANLLVLLPPALGHAHLLVTVEGTDLHEHHVALLPGASGVVPLTVRPAHGTAFRVRATAMRDGRTWSGEAGLLAPPVDRILRVAVAPSSETYRPGSEGTVRLTVTDRDGRPVTGEVGLAAIDAAVLALSPDLAPPVERFFYGPRGLRVRTFSSAAVSFYDAVRPAERLPKREETVPAADSPDESVEREEEPMEEAGGEAGAAFGGRGGRPSTGGGAYRGPAGEVPPGMRAPTSPAPSANPGAAPAKKAKADAAEPPRATFAATALWAPHVVLGPDGSAEVPVTFPDDLTRWRFLAVALDGSGRVGTGVARAVTTRPLRLTVAAPRFLMERDRIHVPVVLRSPVHAGEKATASVEPDPRLEMREGAATSWTLALGENGRAAASLDLRVAGRGTAKILGRAACGDDRDAVEITLPIRAHGVRRVSAVAASLDGNRPWSGRIAIPGDARPGSPKLRLTVEPTHLAAVWRALETLVSYPHGCVEQTLHRFLPDLAAQAAVRELGLPHPRAEELPRLVAAGVDRLAELQHADGGWGWWKEDASDLGMTALVVRGLAQAKALGATPPPHVLEKGVKSLTAMIAHRNPDYTTRALAARALHEAGALPDGLVDRAFDDADRLRKSPATAALLLPVLRAAKRDTEVRALSEELLARAVSDDAGMRWGETRAERWQEDAVETTAVVLAELAASPEVELSALRPIVKWLMSRRDGAAWQSTRDTAAVVRALLALTKRSPARDGQATVRIRLDGGIVGHVRVASRGWAGEAITTEIPPSALTPGASPELVLERVGDLPVDVTAVLEYDSTREDLPAVSEGMTVTRTLHRLEAVRAGDRVVHEKREPAGARVGDLLLVEMAVTPERAGEFLEIEVPFPSGTEALRDQGSVTIAGEEITPLRDAHRELRDDAAWYFLRRAARGTLRMRVLLRVTHAGEFHVMPARAGLMYFPHVHGASAETRLTVEGER